MNGIMLFDLLFAILHFYVPCKVVTLMFTDEIYTFLEIGNLAYENNIFSKPDGLETLKRRSKPKPSPSVVRHAMKAATGGGSNLTDLINKVQHDAASFKAGHEALGNPQLPNSSQGLEQLLPTTLFADSIPVGENMVVTNSNEHNNGETITDVPQIDLSDEDDIDNEQHEVTWEEKALIAESRLEAKINELNKTKSDLNDLMLKVGVLESKLNSTEIMNVGLMAELDQKDQLLSKFNENVANEILNKLKPKLDCLSSIENNTKTILMHSTPIDGIPGNWKDGFSAFSERVESNFSALSEGVKSTNDTLSSYGLDDAGNAIHIPETMQYLSSMNKYYFKALGTPLRDEPTDNSECMYEINGMDPQFVCKCGCGIEVQSLYHENSDTNRTQSLNIDSMDHAHSAHTPNVSTPAALIKKLGIDLSKPPPNIPRKKLEFKPASGECSKNFASGSGLQNRGVKRSVISETPVSSISKRLFTSNKSNLTLHKK